MLAKCVAILYKIQCFKDHFLSRSDGGIFFKTMIVNSLGALFICWKIVLTTTATDKHASVSARVMLLGVGDVPRKVPPMPQTATAQRVRQRDHLQAHLHHD